MPMESPKHEYLILKKVRGVNTQPSREALAPDEFAWLENFMPIGDAFIQAVPAQGTATATIGANLRMQFATLGTVNYQICFNTSGGAQAVNLANGNVVTICSNGTLTGTPAMDQWKSERIVISDEVGMFSWDGTLFHSPGSLATITVVAGGDGYTATPVVTITGGGGSNATAVATLANSAVASISITAVGSGFTAAPAIGFTGGTAGTAATASAYIMPTGMQGDAIAVYSGRVWAGNERTLSFTAPDTWYDVNTANAAGSSTITEGSLRQKIFGMKALDNYLYVFGDSSIIVIGDLKVSGAITTFSQTFLSSTTGTTLPDTITAMERAIVFVNKYGVYALFGASVQKISKALDGIFPKIDFGQKVSAGLAQIYNILCYGFSFTYQDTNGNRSLQAVFFDNKWFFTSQGDSLSFIAPASIDGVLSLWGTSGTDLRMLYADSSAPIDAMLQTGLYDIGNPIFTKQVITAGIEYTAPAAASLTFQVDTESQTTSVNSTTGSVLTWYNDSGNEIDWRNDTNQEITWVATAFLLDYFPAAIGGKYLGSTVTSSSPMLVINGILMEFVKQAGWGRP
jgi:hypothetical protein